MKLKLELIVDEVFEKHAFYVNFLGVSISQLHLINYQLFGTNKTFCNPVILVT